MEFRVWGVQRLGSGAQGAGGLEPGPIKFGLGFGVYLWVTQNYPKAPNHPMYVIFTEFGAQCRYYL